MTCIEERLPCPRCGHKRVVQQARNVYVCFQCRNAWSTTFGRPARPEVPPVDLLAQFQPHEQARLIAYRGAVRCGLYTDWPVARPNETQIAEPPQSERAVGGQVGTLMIGDLAHAAEVTARAAREVGDLSHE